MRSTLLLLATSALCACSGKLGGALLIEAPDAGQRLNLSDAAAGPDSVVDAGAAPDALEAHQDLGVAAPDAAPGDVLGAPDTGLLADAADVADAGEPSDAGPLRVPIFIAQGMVGRTTISCDDGQSFVADRAWDAEGDPHLCGSTQPVVCYQSGLQCSYVGYDGTCSQSNDCDCGHNPGFSKGVAFGAGVIVATWGWGHPGSARQSRDGVHWTETLGNDQFGGLAYGAGRFVLSSRTPQSSPDGARWTPGQEADFRDGLGSGDIIWSVRRFAYADVMGGRFVAVASGNTDRDMLVSSDGGERWWRPAVIPADCATEVSTYGGILSGNGTILIVDESAHACRSTDGGQTWSVARIANTEIYSHGVFTGTEFWFWGNDGNRYSSTDGVRWTPTPLRTPVRIGPVARSDTGTLVAISNVWEGYAQQRMLRSVDDGLSWEELPASKFHRSHPIFYLAFGQAEPSELCPAAR